MATKLYTKYKKIYKKYILNNNYIFYPIIGFISIIAYFYLRFVMLSSKITYNLHNNQPQDLKNQTYLLAFWHGRLLSAFFIRKYFSKSYVLISFNKSAVLIQLIANYFTTKVFKSSNNKSDVNSIRSILKILKNKKTVFAIAPDGSIGPRLYCKDGVITLSFLSKAKILPITYSAKRSIILKSWDCFMIPLPFNHIIVELSNPIDPNLYIKEHLNEMQHNLQNILQETLWNLDKNFNLPKITQSQTDKKGRKPVNKKNPTLQ